MAGVYEASSAFKQDLGTKAVSAQLDAFVERALSPAWQFLHNDTPPWSYAIGDDSGLMPIAYLARYDYTDETPSSMDWQLAVAVADR